MMSMLKSISLWGINLLLNFPIKAGKVKNSRFKTKDNGFGCSYGFADAVPALWVASGILPTMFISSTRFLLRAYDVK